MFLLKKIVSIFLMLFPLSIAVLATGLGLMFFTRRQRAGKVVALAGFAGLIIVGCDPLADVFLSSLEKDHAPLFIGHPSAPDAAARQAKFVVVLGAGYVADRAVPITSQVNANGVARIVEGIRIQREVPDAKLIFSGGQREGVPYAVAAARLATSLGVARTSIATLGAPLDTEQEAALLRKSLGDQPFILVTSAVHLPRAVALMRKQGLRPIPAPADIWVTDPPGVSAWHLMPNARAIEKWNRVLHEYVGHLWSAVRGRI